MSDSTVVREVKGRIRLDTTDLDRAKQASEDLASTIAQRLGAAGENVNALTERTSDLASSFDGVVSGGSAATDSLSTVGSTAVATRTDVDDMAGALDDVAKTSASVDQATASVGDLANQGSTAADSLGQVSAAADDVGKTAAPAADAVGGMAGKTSDLGKDSVVTAEALQSVLEQLKSVPAIGGVAEEALSVLGSSAGVAAGAVLAAAAAAGESANRYADLVTEVRAYSRVTGASAEDSSRMVGALQQVGVNADSGARAITLLSRNVTDHADKLASVGVSVAHTKDGAVDLNQTLLNLADAYVNASSAEERNAIGTTALGRNYRELIPLLEQGSAGVKTLQANVDSTFTDADFQRVEQYRIATARLQMTWDEIVAGAGGPIVDVLTGVDLGLINATKGVEQFDRALNSLKLTDDVWIGSTVNQLSQLKILQNLLGGILPPLGLAMQAVSQHADASNKDAAATDRSRESQQQLNDALQQQTDRLDALNGALRTHLGTILSQQQAELAVSQAITGVGNAQQTQAEAAQRLAEKQQALNGAVRTYGPNSQQAKDAALALSQAQIDQTRAADGAKEANLRVESAMDAAAKAAVDAAKDHAALSGESLSAAQQTDIYVQALEAEAAKLAPDSPLRAEIDAYIQQLESIPRTVHTDVTVSRFVEGSASDSVNPEGRAAGGSVIPGRTYTVGENGPETLVMGARGGVVIPTAARQRADQTFELHQEIDAPIYLDGEQIGRAVQRQVRREMARSRG